MSKMYDSFIRQFGRDAGKVVSNLFFGDSHSTPHRNINSQNSANVDELNQKKLEIQQQEFKQKDLYLLDNAVINAVNQVIAINIPNNEKEIFKVINELEIQLKVNKWLPFHKGEVAKIRNKYPDAVLTKYEQCVFELKFIECSTERLNLTTKNLSKYKKIRFIYKYKLFIAIFVFLILFILIGINAG